MRQYALNYLHTVQSYGSGKPPKEWKTTIVSPIHKKDNKSSPKNYQPISLTCIKPSSSSTVEIDKNTFFGSSLIKSLYRGYLRMPNSPCFLHQIVGFNEIVAFTMLLTQPRPKTTWRKQLKKSKPRLLMIEGSAKNYLEIVTSFRYFSNFKPQPPSFSFTWKEFPYLVDKVAVVKP